MDVRFLRVYGLFCGDKSDTVCMYLSVVTRKRSCPLFDFMKKREFVLIEHYFTNDEIKRSNEQGQRLFLGNEFNKVGNHNSEDYNYHYIGKLYNTIKNIERETDKNVTDKNGNGVILFSNSSSFVSCPKFIISNLRLFIQITVYRNKGANVKTE